MKSPGESESDLCCVCYEEDVEVKIHLCSNIQRISHFLVTALQQNWKSTTSM